ncbi:Os10g0360750 [Oryza sativa Japonica Group]|uniref:Os10g0360750 protein n=1 Tax=Oryza sativa subsp. japonica TaxID=39947 RepID=Q339F6_ORYSJ|nr:hypothetical protein LOC_Os10g21640 [Oryza sativa Japonica Group]BAT10498.1 Os10g0360750 [Oryza sativa Japonica Group]
MACGKTWHGEARPPRRYGPARDGKMVGSDSGRGRRQGLRPAAARAVVARRGQAARHGRRGKAAAAEATLGQRRSKAAAVARWLGKRRQWRYRDGDTQNKEVKQKDTSPGNNGDRWRSDDGGDPAGTHGRR